MRTTAISFFLLLTIVLLSVVQCQFLRKQIRRWFVVGNFERVVQSDGTNITVNNVASWNGERWRGYAGGTNGHVNIVVVDSCLNIWIGGKFTHAGGVETGPVAVWRRGAINWARVGQFNSTEDDEVFAISSYCYSIPSDSDRCLCDVNIGGLFNMTLNDNIEDNLVNIARYDSKKKSWNSLGGVHSHNITTPVLIIQNSDWGSILVVHRYMWVGGQGFFNRYDFQNKVWKSYSDHIKPGDVVNDVYYNPNDYDDYDIIVAGQFSFNPVESDNSTNCTNICIYTSSDESWRPLPDTLGGTNVVALAFAGVSVFAIGDLVNSYNDNETAVETYGSAFKWKSRRVDRALVRSWENITYNSTDYDDILSRPIASIDVCGLSDVACPPDSFTIVGSGDTPDDGFIQFYNHKTKEWSTFGYGFNGSGEAYAVTSLNFVDDESVAQKTLHSIASSLILSLLALFICSNI
jgi:hypothetical protein